MTDIIDISNMTIADINNVIRRLDNQLYYWLNEKEKAFDKTQPRATKFEGERIQGGTTREDKNALYLFRCDEIDPFINEIQDKIFNLTKYVESELRRIGEYDPLMKKIVELREVNKMTWYKIGEATNYSDSQCKRIYRRYINNRNIEDEPLMHRKAC